MMPKFIQRLKLSFNYLDNFQIFLASICSAIPTGLVVLYLRGTSLGASFTTWSVGAFFWIMLFAVAVINMAALRHGDSKL